jgi:TonB-linked SusC/RagA family outer membrane protein
MKIFFVLLILFLPVTMLFAQNQLLVKGTVTDSKNETLPGVSVIIKGTAQGTITNGDGQYALQTSPQAVLLFSYVGYDPLEVAVNNQTNINVQLKEQLFDLGEVVVVGYGTTEVRDLTAPIKTIKGNEITKQTVTNAAQVLQGKVAGVQISNNGAPGSSPTIRIRGLGTVSSSADPLYVVDDVFVNDISFLSPNNIESITILKDASSASIYGVRAANGVIVITTKRGKNQNASVTYNGYYGIQNASNLLDMADTPEYIKLINEKMYANYQRDTKHGSYQPFDVSKYPANTNWFDEILRTAKIQNHEINIAGGNEKSNYYLGAGITEQEGIVKGNDYSRVNIRGSQDVKVSDLLKAGYNVTLSGWTTNNAANVLGQAYLAPPAFNPMLNDSVYTDPVILGFGNFANPAASINYYNNLGQGLKSLTNVYAEISPMKDLIFRTSFTLDATHSQSRNYSPKYWVSITQNDTISHLSKSQEQNINYTWDNTANYQRTIGNHRIKAMAGLSFVQFRSQYLNASTSRVPYVTESTLYLSNGDKDNLAANDGGSKIRSASYFGRLFYSYKNKYLLTGTLRRDGSSTFPAGNRWSTSPSVGLGWVASEESFLSEVKSLNYLKVRASWGYLGNNNVPQNAYTVTVNSSPMYSIVYGPYGSTAISNGASITSIVEPLLLWEIVEEFDAGVEATLFNNQLNLELDYYHRITKDAIFPVPLIGTSGTSGGSVLDNNADILNSGIEFTLEWNKEVNKNLSYKIGTNITTIHNEVKTLVPGTLPFYDGGVYNGNLATYTQQGHPIGEFYVLEVAGVFQNFDEVNNYKTAEGVVIMPKAAPGDLKFTDRNNDGAIDNKDRIPVGSYTPKLMYGFNLGLNVYDFDLSVDCQGVAGNKIYNAKRANRFGNENYDADFYANSWHGEGTSNSYPSADIAGGKNAFPSTFFVESGAYFRIRNIQLGYTIPKMVTNKLRINKLRVFVTSQNPFTTFKYNGFSPEIPGGSPANQGIDHGVYPLSTTTSFGLNLNF